MGDHRFSSLSKDGRHDTCPQECMAEGGGVGQSMAGHRAASHGGVQNTQQPAQQHTLSVPQRTLHENLTETENPSYKSNLKKSMGYFQGTSECAQVLILKGPFYLF